MTKTEIIKETAEFYNANPNKRAVKQINHIGNKCYYLQPGTGNMCAVGRCMKPGIPDDFQGGVRGYFAQKIAKEDWSELSPDEEDNASIDSVLQERYCGHSIQFWSDVQSFHDWTNNWDKCGLTEIGKIQLEGLLARYKNQ